MIKVAFPFMRACIFYLTEFVRVTNSDQTIIVREEIRTKGITNIKHSLIRICDTDKNRTDKVRRIKYTHKTKRSLTDLNPTGSILIRMLVNLQLCMYMYVPHNGQRSVDDLLNSNAVTNTHTNDLVWDYKFSQPSSFRTSTRPGELK